MRVEGLLECREKLVVVDCETEAVGSPNDSAAERARTSRLTRGEDTGV